MKISNLEQAIDYLFDRSFSEWLELPDEETDAMEDLFNKTVDKYGWDKTYQTICLLMKKKCIDGNSAKEFAEFCCAYRLYEHPLPNSFEFLGYLYYKMNLLPAEYDAVDIMDSLTFELMKMSGDYNRNPYWNPDYIPETDPEIIKAVEKWRELDAT